MTNPEKTVILTLTMHVFVYSLFSCTFSSQEMDLDYDTNWTQQFWYYIKSVQLQQLHQCNYIK